MQLTLKTLKRGKVCQHLCWYFCLPWSHFAKLLKAKELASRRSFAAASELSSELMMKILRKVPPI